MSFSDGGVNESVFEYNWINKRNKDKKLAITHDKIKENKKSLEKYKAEDSKWILKGKYLYREGKEKEKQNRNK